MLSTAGSGGGRVSFLNGSRSLFNGWTHRNGVSAANNKPPPPTSPPPKATAEDSAASSRIPVPKSGTKQLRRSRTPSPALSDASTQTPRRAATEEEAEAAEGRRSGRTASGAQRGRRRRFRPTILGRKPGNTSESAIIFLRKIKNSVTKGPFLGFFICNFCNLIFLTGPIRREPLPAQVGQDYVSTIGMGRRGEQRGWPLVMSLEERESNSSRWPP